MLEDYHGMAQLKQEGEPYNPLMPNWVEYPSGKCGRWDRPGEVWQCVWPGEGLTLANGAHISNHGDSEAYFRLDGNGDLYQGSEIITICRLQATIKAKDEIIAGLRDELRHAEDRIDAANMACRSALEARDRHKQDSELRGTGLSVLTEANKDLWTKLDMQTAETAQCMARIKELEAKLAGKAEPNTRDMSRLGHFGESHAKNGLSLFDRYY